MVHNYLTRAHLFATQREWFAAAARRKAILHLLFIMGLSDRHQLHRHIILRGLYEEHFELLTRYWQKRIQEGLAS